MDLINYSIEDFYINIFRTKDNTDNNLKRLEKEFKIDQCEIVKKIFIANFLESYSKSLSFCQDIENEFNFNIEKEIENRLDQRETLNNSDVINELSSRL